MATNRIGVISVKGGVTCKDHLAGGDTSRALRKARKANSEVENLTLDLELKAIELAMRGDRK